MRAFYEGLPLRRKADLPELSPQRRTLVEEDIACHLSMVEELKDGLPFWPMGPGRFGDPFLCVGVDCGNRAYLAL